MGKHTSVAHAPALVAFLLLMCFAIHAHCKYWAFQRSIVHISYFNLVDQYWILIRILMTDIRFFHVGRVIDDEHKKNGLCTYKNHSPDCKSSSLCYCCSETNDCYKTMFLCGLECKNPSLSSSKVATPTHPPLPSRQF